MEHEKDTSIIYIKDLVFSALYQWRKVIIAAVVLALLLGGYKGFTTWKSVSGSDTRQAASAMEQYEAKKAFLTQKTALLTLEQAQYAAYLEGSVFMALDANNLYAADISLFVDMPDRSTADSPDHTSDIVSAYSRLFQSGAVLDAIAQEANLTSQQLSELITVEVEDASDTVQYGSFLVRICHTGRDGAQQLLELFTARLPQLETQVAGSVKPHSLKIISQSVSAVALDSVAEKQAKVMEKLDSIKQSSAETETALAALIAPAEDGNPVMAATKKGIKFALIGGVLGILLVGGLAMVFHVGRRKVYSVRTLTDRTGIRVLGCIPSPDKKENAIDIWLKKLEGRTVTDTSAYLAASLRNCCSGQVLVTGDCGADAMSRILDILKSAGISVICGGNILEDAAAVEALPRCDTVLMVEKCGTSHYSSIQQQAQAIRDQEKRMPGCILIDG